MMITSSRNSGAGPYKARYRNANDVRSAMIAAGSA